MESIGQSSNTIVLENRQQLEISGVTRVDSFDAKEFALDTTKGYLHVQGTDLTIGSMNLEKGLLVIKGNVDCVRFTNKSKASGNKEGFFAKLFK